jgi:hypothetical protein
MASPVSQVARKRSLYSLYFKTAKPKPRGRPKGESVAALQRRILINESYLELGDKHKQWPLWPLTQKVKAIQKLLLKQHGININAETIRRRLTETFSKSKTKKVSK